MITSEEQQCIDDAYNEVDLIIVELEEQLTEL